MGDKLADLVLEFLEAAVHETLFSWQVYPAESFEKTALYNVPIHMNRHPLLCEYVHSALGGCRAWLASAELDKLSLVALSDTGRVVRTLVVEPQIIDCSVADAAAGEQEPALPLRQLEEVFRTALVAVVAAPLIADNGEKTGGKPASFRILAYTVEDAARPDTAVNGANASNSWILADQLWRGEMAQQRSVFPVKTVQSADCPVKINLFMQTAEHSDNGTRS